MTADSNPSGEFQLKEVRDGGVTVLTQYTYDPALGR